MHALHPHRAFVTTLLLPLAVAVTFPAAVPPCPSPNQRPAPNDRGTAPSHRVLQSYQAWKEAAGLLSLIHLQRQEVAPGQGLMDTSTSTNEAAGAHSRPGVRGNKLLAVRFCLGKSIYHRTGVVRCASIFGHPPAVFFRASGGPIFLQKTAKKA